MCDELWIYEYSWAIIIDITEFQLEILLLIIKTSNTQKNNDEFESKSIENNNTMMSLRVRA